MGEVIVCSRCRVDVPVENVGMPKRCRDDACPLNALDIPDFLRRRDAVRCLRCLAEIPTEHAAVIVECKKPKCPLNAIHAIKEPAS